MAVLCSSCKVGVAVVTECDKPFCVPCWRKLFAPGMVKKSKK